MIRPQTCPICERELTMNGENSPKTFPFCSKRCQQVDLYRWSEGKYSIAEPCDPNIEGDESQQLPS